MTRNRDPDDPRERFERLWERDEPVRRGPKPRLSTETVVRAAIALADAEGLGSLSMRRVAEAVGVSPMSLYTYVPSKAELVDMMFDQILGDTSDPDATVVTWRDKLTFIARERWASSERHPWLLDVAMHRPPLGPNVMRKAQVMLSALDGMHLGPEEASLAAETLQDYITGALRAAREARQAEALSGLSDEAWFDRVSPVLARRLDPRDYDALSRISEARRRQAHSPGHAAARFEFGLQRVLDGLETYIHRRNGEAG